MQHAKKMVLVSPEVLSSIKDRPVSSTATNTARLDQELKDTLNRQDLQPYDKVQLYNQILQRYLSYYDQTAKRPIRVSVTRDTLDEFNQQQPPQQDNPPPQEQGDDAHLPVNGAEGLSPLDDSSKRLLLNFPVNLMTKARSMLELVKNSGGIVDYNDKGELIREGEVISGSHISDLIYDVLLGRRGFEPRGWEHFLGGLVKLNVPERIISNTTRRYKMRQMKQQGWTPPRTPSAPPNRSKTSKKKSSAKQAPIKRKARLNWESYPAT